MVDLGVSFPGCTSCTLKVPGGLRAQHAGPTAGVCRLVDALEWLVGWFHGLPELIPEGFPWQLLRDLAPDMEPAPVDAEPAGVPCLQ